MLKTTVLVLLVLGLIIFSSVAAKIKSKRDDIAVEERLREKGTTQSTIEEGYAMDVGPEIGRESETVVGFAGFVLALVLAALIVVLLSGIASR